MKILNWIKTHKLLMILPIMAITLAACDWGGSPAQNVSTDATVAQGTQRYEQLIAEKNQQTLDKNQPIPLLDKSVERANLTKRLTTFNDPNKVSYIYLVNFGKVMAFYTIKGKVSSVNSMLTTTQQIVDMNGQPCNADHEYQGSVPCFVVNSPDIDGSYGSNGNSIFFFTTDGVYVEWQGDYMLADQPLKLSTQPELIQTIK